METYKSHYYYVLKNSNDSVLIVKAESRIQVVNARFRPFLFVARFDCYDDAKKFSMSIARRDSRENSFDITYTSVVNIPYVD